MSDPLRRLLIELASAPNSSTPSADRGARLERAARHVSVPLARLALTLDQVQGTLALSRDKISHLQVPAIDPGATSTQHLVANALVTCGPWIDLNDRDNIWEVAKAVAGRERYFGESDSQQDTEDDDSTHPSLQSQASWIFHLASISYYTRFGRALEARYTKLYYPIKCPWTLRDPQTIDHNLLLPENQRGRNYVVVLGLQGQGKSALCGRIIHALGQSSPLALSRVQSAARRLVPDCTADAVWMANRNVVERTESMTLSVNDYPVYHPSIGSLVVVDTPPFFGYQAVQENERMNQSLPRCGTLRREVIQALTLLDPLLVVICVAVDRDWSTEQFLELVRQVRACTFWPKTMLVFAVTRMDTVDWSQAAFDRTSQRIREVVGEHNLSDTTIIATSAVVPAPGILFSPSASWAKDAKLPSILSLLHECASAAWKRENQSPDQHGIAKAWIVRKVRKEEDCEIVQAIVVEGSFVAGQLVQIETIERHTRYEWSLKRDRYNHRCLCDRVVRQKEIKSIEWYGYPCSAAYAGQKVGLKIRTESPPNIAPNRLARIRDLQPQLNGSFVIVKEILSNGRVLVDRVVFSDNSYNSRQNLSVLPEKLEPLREENIPTSKFFSARTSSNQPQSKGSKSPEYVCSRTVLSSMQSRAIEEGSQQPLVGSVKIWLNLQTNERDIEKLKVKVVPRKGYECSWHCNLMVYPNKIPVSLHHIEILETKGSDGSTLAAIVLEGRDTDFFLGQRLAGYLSKPVFEGVEEDYMSPSGWEESKNIHVFGLVAEVSGICLPEKMQADALEWISRSLMLPESNIDYRPTPPTQHRMHDACLLSPLPAIQRDKSTFSAISLGLSELGECSLASGPATSINEAIRQTEVAIHSMMMLREELERAQKALYSVQSEDRKTRPCYMCRRQCPMTSPDPIAAVICNDCTDLNASKRSSDLGFDCLDDDCAFVVTGARIKIGYAVVERLLSSGAKLLVLTTRFPHLLAEKLQVEHGEAITDKVTVHIYGVDFRSVPSVIALGQHLTKYYPKVFALINNAAQTVRRPPAFYATLVQKELNLARNAGALTTLVKIIGGDPFKDSCASTDALVKGNIDESLPLVKSFNDCESYAACSSALMTQCEVLQEDVASRASTIEGQTVFPRSDGYDESTGEYVQDRRESVSWTKSILPNGNTEETVESVEFLEVLLVNTLAPFILLKELVHSLSSAEGNVINVSSREGVFERVQYSDHPHTNAAKAGLNMLTRTSSYELKRCSVMICSVDTGWVSKYVKSGFLPDGSPKGTRPPLTVEDGAARVIDPIVQRMRDAADRKRFRTGVLYRNFKAVPFS